MNNLSRVGVDLAKNIFQLHGVDRTETSTWCHRLKRDNWIQVLLNKVEPGPRYPLEGCVSLVWKRVPAHIIGHDYFKPKAFMSS